MGGLQEVISRMKAYNRKIEEEVQSTGHGNDMYFVSREVLLDKGLLIRCVAPEKMTNACW